uniref:C1q domain-containing protein n=1 Tax=Pundamilia nyererei TaxID=303518 RepID=A0A3B4GC86_9CICH
MKIIMFLPLLLLVCSVSADQTETAEQQSSKQDIHAVLRELTASLINDAMKQNRWRQKTETDQLKLQSKEIVFKMTFLSLSVKQVAFSASLLDQGEGDTGPFNDHTTLIFKHVITNIGNAYNPSTGIFTAPVRGAYHFDLTIVGHGNIVAGAFLLRNGEQISITYENPTSGTVSASNGASLLLEVGDQVFVRLLAGARIFDSQSHHNTFSGHLIFTM